MTNSQTIVAIPLAGNYKQLSDLKYAANNYRKDPLEALNTNKRIAEPILPTVPQLADLRLSGSEEVRTTALLKFAARLTPSRRIWLNKIHEIDWTAADWSRSAYPMFLEGCQQGSNGKAVYAVVAGLLTLRGIPIPATLNEPLWTAIRRQGEALAQSRGTS